MKVIFLDIDGVLNTNFTKETTPDGYTGIDDDKVQLLHRIVEATGAEVVLSSSWRENWIPELNIESQTDDDVRYMLNKFKAYGITPIDKTPHIRNWKQDRYDEITMWLAEHNDVTDYVILDDVVYYGYLSKETWSHCILTDSNVGLNEEFVDVAIAILQGDDSIEE